MSDGRRLLGPGLLIGVGVGAFFDGIVFHQLLQWHHMLSNTEDAPVTTVAGLEVNTLADGVFLAVGFVCGALGVALLWRQVRTGAPPRGSLLGLALAGWGLFNVVEGLVDHHLLRVHHVRDDVASPLLWDLGFLALGVALLFGGLALHRRAAAEDDRSVRRRAAA